jgi:hypothetical protein
VHRILGLAVLREFGEHLRREVTGKARSGHPPRELTGNGLSSLVCTNRAPPRWGATARVYPPRLLVAQFLRRPAVLLKPAAASGGDDEFSAGVARLHGRMRLGDLIEFVDLIDGYDGVTGGDSVQEVL